MTLIKLITRAESNGVNKYQKSYTANKLST